MTDGGGIFKGLREFNLNLFFLKAGVFLIKHHDPGEDVRQI